MKVILVEDDKNECEIFERIIQNKNEIKLVATTNSSTEAIKLVRKYKPDAIILDLELTNGEGSGLEFIENAKQMTLEHFPKIIVTTNIYSDSIYNFLHKNKVDFIFYKNQANFSHENVLNTLLLLQGYENKNNIVTSGANMSNDDVNDKLADLINKELDLIGVSTHLKGRKYLFDGICFVIQDNGNGSNISVVQYLVGKYKRASSTISRAMQNAILHAWRISSIEDLSVLYTARINYETGVPTPMEFIYYYSDKIKKCL
ncbi:MAG: response regulator [Clostridia bacterium]|nr:response regulator [Clostridia bacterium]